MFRIDSLTIGTIVVICLSLFVALAMLLTPSYGFWGYGGCCGCQNTWCAWSETWHAPSALDTPLRPYYVPRMPGRCGIDGSPGWADDCQCAMTAAGCTSGGGCGCDYPPQAAIGLDPVQFERLGQVPNDLGLGSLPVESPQGR